MNALECGLDRVVKLGELHGDGLAVLELIVAEVQVLEYLARVELDEQMLADLLAEAEALHQ